MRGTGSEEAGEGVSQTAEADADVTGEVEPTGHFRIYLGAAPGVGKTYAMLSEGHRRRDAAPMSSPDSSRATGGRSPRR